MNVPGISESFYTFFKFIFYFYLHDLDIGDFVGTTIDDITKCKLSKNHFKASPIITTNLLLQMSLHTYLRTSMGQTRFSALALLHINSDTNVDIYNVIDIFAKKKEKALEFVNNYDINND